jgi:hypothetical protein
MVVLRFYLIGEREKMAMPWKRFATLVAVTAALGLMLPSLGSAATNNTVVSEIPVNSIVFDSCTGETVTLTGSARVILTQTTDAAGGSHVTILLLFSQVTGTGPTGTSYRLISTAMSTSQQSSSGLAGVTFVTKTLLVSAGSARNQAESIVTRFTVTPSGQVTQIAMSAFGCQG